MASNRMFSLFFLVTFVFVPVLRADIDVVRIESAVKDLVSILEEQYSADSLSGERYKSLKRQLIELFREPSADSPTGYRWCKLLRECSEQRKVASRRVYLDFSKTKEGVIVSGKAPLAYELVISVPRRRSMHSGNHSVYIYDVTLLFDANGKRQTVTNKVEKWVRRKHKLSFPLPEIGKNVEARVRCAINRKEGSKSLIELYLCLPKVVDDEEGPNYRAIKILKDMPDELPTFTDEKQALAAKAKELFNVVTGDDYGSDSRNYELRRRLEYVDYLLGGRLDDVRKARVELRKIIDDLSGGQK